MTRSVLLSNELGGKLALQDIGVKGDRYAVVSWMQGEETLKFVIISIQTFEIELTKTQAITQTEDHPLLFAQYDFDSIVVWAFSKKNYNYYQWKVYEVTVDWNQMEYVDRYTKLSKSVTATTSYNFETTKLFKGLSKDPFEDAYVACYNDATVQMEKYTVSGGNLVQQVLHTGTMLKTFESITNCFYSQTENTLAAGHPDGVAVLQIDWDEKTMHTLNQFSDVMPNDKD